MAKRKPPEKKPAGKARQRSAGPRKPTGGAGVDGRKKSWQPRLVSRPEAGKESAFPVVAMGASAGGLEAITDVLANLPVKPGIAIVIVQHLAPNFESAIPALLSAKVRMPVLQVKEGMTLERDHIYVIPPNTVMTLADGHFHLEPRSTDPANHPIDAFFRSVAEHCGNGGIGMVLSGTASDGAHGLVEIKAAGGITIAQEPKTARYGDMPQAAIATGSVDLILGPREMAEELIRIGRHPYARPAPQRASTEEFDVADPHMQRIFGMLRSATGVDFTSYKPPTIQRRLQRRLVLNKLASVDAYIKFMQENPGEIQKLYQDILINVTRFFREPESFDALKSVAFPEIIKHHAEDGPIRLWVPGCATGEEAYSVAIALLEFLGDTAGGMNIQVFATDISEPAIDHARAGVYPTGIEADVSPERLRRFFTKADGHYRVNKVVREMCVFARQDVTRDPPFSKLDMVICRNLLIYLGANLQKKLMGMFHYALRPYGFLVLGSAETVGLHAELFSIVDKKHRIYRKKMEVSTGLPFPVDHVSTRGGPERRPAVAPRTETSIQAEANRVILERFTPPAVIVNGELQIIQFRGQTGAYLEPAPGEASLNLLKMAREGLLYGLRTALTEARRSNKPARKSGLKVKSEGKLRQVSVEVIPLPVTSGGPSYLILFTEAAAVPVPAKEGRPRRPTAEDNRAVALERELAASREYLQSVIQDLEAANEELQSANEEILSSNEELQSTNEELDTAKEELQSTNEELNTVNEELHGRNEEMARVNSDLLNLLGSMNLAIVMVAGDLRIRRFTPMAERVLNLIPTDIGRPISQIKPNIDCPDLEELITEVIDTVTPRTRDVQDQNGTRYSLRIRPYKSTENRIDGAVLALIDISGEQRESDLERARDFAEAIVATIREPLAVLDADLRIRSTNEPFCQLMGIKRELAVGQPLASMGDGLMNVAGLREWLREILESGDQARPFQLDREYTRQGEKAMTLSARRLPPLAGLGAMLLLKMTEQQANEERPANGA